MSDEVVASDVPRCTCSFSSYIFGFFFHREYARLRFLFIHFSTLCSAFFSFFSVKLFPWSHLFFSNFWLLSFSPLVVLFMHIRAFSSFRGSVSSVLSSFNSIFLLLFSKNSLPPPLRSRITMNTDVGSKSTDLSTGLLADPLAPLNQSRARWKLNDYMANFAVLFSVLDHITLMKTRIP